MGTGGNRNTLERLNLGKCYKLWLVLVSQGVIFRQIFAHLVCDKTPAQDVCLTHHLITGLDHELIYIGLGVVACLNII